MKNILILYDIDNNGKTSYELLETKCILNYSNNIRIDLHDINIINNKLIYNNKELDINSYSIIIFNYGEDKTILDKKLYINKFINKFNNWENFINFIKKIKDIIVNKNNNILIYNNPDYYDIITNSQIMHDYIKTNNIPINIAYSELINDNNINNINKFPIIIHSNYQTCGNNKFICNNKKQLIKNYNKLKLNNIQDISVCEYLDSYVKDIDVKISIRIIAINDKIIDFYVLPSNEWNIHVKDILINKVKEANNYFKNWLDKNQLYINNLFINLFNKLGHGLYAHDFLLHNNKLYLLELSYKSYYVAYSLLLKTHNIKLNKNYENNNYIKMYNDIIINF